MYCTVLYCTGTVLQVRTDVGPQCPGGKNWTSVDGDYKSIAVSGRGHVWAVGTTDRSVCM